MALIELAASVALVTSRPPFAFKPFSSTVSWSMPARVVLAPISGPRLNLPHGQPASSLPAAMEPEQAAQAAELLGADRLIPIHYGGYALPGLYEPVDDPVERLTAATDSATPIRPGETVEL
jgi:L-ascorbate metabolism protein UlaG (beta-lactamase superfamily)